MVFSHWSDGWCLCFLSLSKGWIKIHLHSHIRNNRMLYSLAKVYVKTLLCSVKTYNEESWTLWHTLERRTCPLYNDIMITSVNEHEVASVVEASVRCAFKKIGFNMMKTREIDTSAEMLGFQWSGTCWDIPSKLKDRWLYLLPVMHPNCRYGTRFGVFLQKKAYLSEKKEKKKKA